MQSWVRLKSLTCIPRQQSISHAFKRTHHRLLLELRERPCPLLVTELPLLLCAVRAASCCLCIEPAEVAEGGLPAELPDERTLRSLWLAFCQNARSLRLLFADDTGEGSRSIDVPDFEGNAYRGDGNSDEPRLPEISVDKVNPLRR